MNDLIEYSDRSALFTGLANAVAGQLAEALKTQAFATLCVPGGTTPGPMFERLRAADLDWARVRVILGDERFVPESSDRSNTGLLRRTLLQGRAAAAQLIPLYHPADRPEDVIDRLIEGLCKALPLDVCILGMGTDMHTASLFPGADQLALGLSGNAPALLAMRAPGAPEPRITLTAPVLRGARHLHILIAGDEKKEALERAQSEPDWTKAPIGLALSRDPAPSIHFAS